MNENLTTENQGGAPAALPVNAKNMKQCKACGASIAKNAKTCPSCGAKNKKPIFKRVWFWILVIALIAIIVSVAKGKKSYNFDKPEQIVTVDTILSDFRENSAAAGEKYSDKVIAVTGKVSSIDDDHIILNAYDDDLWLYGVWAYFDDKEELKSFVNGTTVTIVGVCDEENIFDDVNVRQCKTGDKFALTPEYDKALDVDAAEIVKAYQKNPASADDDYKYKTVRLTGKVRNISDDYAIIEPKGTSEWDFDSGVEVYFENDTDLTGISEGKTVTVTGECYGKADMYPVKLCRAIVE